MAHLFFAARQRSRAREATGRVAASGLRKLFQSASLRCARDREALGLRERRSERRAHSSSRERCGWPLSSLACPPSFLRAFLLPDIFEAALHLRDLLVDFSHDLAKHVATVLLSLVDARLKLMQV